MRSEFQFIQHIRDKYGLARVGDDCAVIPKDAKSDLVVTSDLLIEDIDFRLEWTTAGALGHKALAVSLSDIAAMAAIPKWTMLSIGVPEELWKTDFVDRLYDGWHSLADTWKVELIGGDVSRSPYKLVIDSIAIGEVRKDGAVMRSGARPGDVIFVSGTLGGAAAGLQLLEHGVQPDPPNSRHLALIKRQLKPVPRVDIAKQLAELSIATSMIDISDGLSSDLLHICEASRVGAQVDANALPIDPNIENPDLGLVLNGGEDFELLFTLTSENVDKLRALDVTRIGTITADTENMQLFIDGNLTPFKPEGYRHF